MNKLFSGYELRYMKIRSSPPIEGMMKIHYPEVRIKLFEKERKGKTDWLINPTGWQRSKIVWRY